MTLQECDEESVRIMNLSHKELVKEIMEAKPDNFDFTESCLLGFEDRKLRHILFGIAFLREKKLLTV